MDTNVYKFLRWTAVVAVGLCLGLLVHFSFVIKMRYALPLLGALLMFLTGVLTRDFKFFFQILLVSSCFFTVRKSLIALDPFMHSGGPSNIEVLNADFILIILYGIWFYERAYRGKGAPITVTRIGWCLIAFIAVEILSVINAPSPMFVLFEVVRNIRIFFFVLYIVHNLNTERHLRMTILVISGFMCFNGVMCILQYVTHNPLYIPVVMSPPAPGGEDYVRQFGIRRVGGLTGSSNLLGTWLMILCPVLFTSFFLPLKKRGRILVASAFLLSVVSLILTGTRAAWLAIPSTVVVVLYLCFKKGILSLRRNLSHFVMGSMLFLVVVMPLAPYFYHRIAYKLVGAEYCRLYLMALAAKMIAAHPLIGNGANNFNLTNLGYRREFQPFPRCKLGHGLYHVVHNLWLLIAADSGLLGLFISLLILLVGVLNCLPGLRSKNPYLLCLSIGLIAQVQAFFIAELNDWGTVQFPQVYLTFWLLMALTEIVRNASVDEKMNRATL